MPEIEFPTWHKLTATKQFDFKSALISDLSCQPGQALGKKLLREEDVQFYEFSPELLLLDLPRSADIDRWRAAVRAALDAGARHFVLCSTAQPTSQSDDLDGIIVTDHINLSGKNPLVGPNVEQYGPRFPDVTKMYERDSAAAVQALAQRSGLLLEPRLMLIPRQSTLLTDLEQQVIRQNRVAAIGGAIFSAAITAAHAGCRSTAILFFRLPPERQLTAWLRELLLVLRQP